MIVATVRLLHPRDCYTACQITTALGIAIKLNRGKLILCEPPLRVPHD